MSIVDISPQIEILRALRLVAPDGVFEIRMPKTRDKGTWAGYFDDQGAALNIISQADKQPTVPAIYVTLNPVNPAILARSENRLTPNCHTTTTDNDILRRRWFPLDFDPIRPVGISSADVEHERSLELAKEVADFLVERGWPEPVFADSGNGAHLLFTVDLPNSQAVTDIFRNAMYAVSGMFSDSTVSIDTSIHNASRIFKLYGTLTRKGDNTRERPHRRSRILSVPEKLDLVTLEQLKELGATWAPAVVSDLQDKSHRSYLADMPSWLQSLGVKIDTLNPTNLGEDGVKWRLSQCPFNENHTRPIVGILKGKFPIFRCLAASCKDNHWQEFRSAVDPSYVKPDEFVQEVVKLYGETSAQIVFDRYKAQLATLSNASRTGLLSKIKDRTDRNWLKTKIDEERLDGAEEKVLSSRKGNFTGLVYDVRCLQADGRVPEMWIDEMSERRWMQYKGHPVESLDSDTLALRILPMFHSRGAEWVNKGILRDAVHNICDENRVNPLKDWLETLIWDGVPRLDTWLTEYLSVKRTRYSGTVGRKWFISMIARVMRPGCQADYMLILEGKQGLKKTSALRILGGDYYTEYTGGMTSDSEYRDMVAKITGKMVVEISELSTFKRGSIEKIKHMLTATEDDVRLAYRVDIKRFPRTCVFVGTTNEVYGTYIHDNTGARRFWPVVVMNNIDTEKLKHDRSQLFAEALHAYRNNELWWIEPEGNEELESEIKEEQESRTADNAEEMLIGKLLEDVINPEMYAQGILRPQFEHLAGGKDAPPEKMTVRIEDASKFMRVIAGSDSMRVREVVQMWNVLKRVGFHRPHKSGGARVWREDKCGELMFLTGMEKFLTGKEWETIVTQYATTLKEIDEHGNRSDENS